VAPPSRQNAQKSGRSGIGYAESVAPPRRIGGAYPLSDAELVARLRRIGGAFFIQNISEYSLQNILQNFSEKGGLKK
jgi:hypothetical protein